MVSTLARTGLLGQVVPDHVGHISVDALVVRHARPRRVNQRHVAELISVHQPGYAEQGVGPEDQRVHEVVVQPPVDHVHASQPLCGTHIDEAVVDEEVPAFHEFRAEFAGQETCVRRKWRCRHRG